MNAPLKKLSELTGVAFDGVRSGYVPPKKLSISKKLRLHRKAKRSIDPVTFEVVRHALWNVNEEHGAAHQMDVMLLCPVFWKGELFCWVTNCLHQYDIGGITPGSFCPSARDAFDEGILIPPVKIVERNEIRRDIEEVYLRSSRKPSAVALDFRAQLAGNMTARDRIFSLIRRYGAETVKGVMKKILDDGERAFLKKLAALPDGVWRDRP